MRKLVSKVILCLGCFFIYSTISAQGDIISREMKEVLDKEVSKPLRVYSLDLEEGKRIDEAFRRWVSGSIDLTRAKKRVSRRFRNRVIYHQQVQKNIPRFIKDELNKKGLKNSRPIDIFYKRGLNWFSFRKVLEVEGKRRINEEKLVKMAKDFILDNNFVKLTESDKFAKIDIKEIILDKDSAPDSPGGRVLMLQGVRFWRQFLGKPVVNSKIIIDFHPDTEEILGFKHYNWTPVQEGFGTRVPRRLVKDSREVERILRKKVRKYCRASERAKIEKITRAWFETETELVPILACEIKVEKIGRKDIPQRRYIEYINLAGSDDVFLFPRVRKSKPKIKPKAAPKM